MVKALPLIDADPFFAVNSDNLWVDGPVDALKLLAAGWDEARMDALLLLVPLARANCHHGRGDFHMSATGALTPPPAARRRAVRLHRHPDGLEAPVRRRSARRAVFHQPALGPRDRQGALFGAVHQGLWFDVGRPESIGQAEEILSAG